MVIESFAALERAIVGRRVLRPVVVGAEDAETLSALAAAAERGLTEDAFLVGDEPAIRTQLAKTPLKGCRIEHANSSDEAAAFAVTAVRGGMADVLIKGNVDSATYLRAVVARETGLRASRVLSNVTLAEMPSLPRLIGATDNGIIPSPDLEQKRSIIRNALPLFAGLGVAPVRVAAIAASEKVNTRQPATIDAASLAAESARSESVEFIVDGPFGYDVALSREAAEKKGFGTSLVAGDADLILFPSIEAGNATVKSWKLHGRARTASIVLGAQVPVLLNSRSDGMEQRLSGLLLAGAILAGREGGL